MKKKEFVSSKGYIISNPKFMGKEDNLKLLRVVITPLETKVDFGYQATNYYKRGGWIKINQLTFIRTDNSNEKLFLTNATNIPYGPERLNFNSTIEFRYFSLHFPPLNENVNYFDLIEEEGGGDTVFNFFQIDLSDIRKKELIF